MESSTFDTLDYARRLTEAGVPAANAALQAEIMGEAMQEVASLRVPILNLDAKFTVEFARQDSKIDSGFAELRTEIARLDGKIDTGLAELRKEMSERETRLVRWGVKMVGALGVLNVSSIAAMKLLG